MADPVEASISPPITVLNLFALGLPYGRRYSVVVPIILEKLRLGMERD